MLKAAACVTVIDDREGDIYAKWASVAAQNFHLLTRSMHDCALIDGTSLYATAAAFPIADVTTIDLPVRAHQPARQAKLSRHLRNEFRQHARGEYGYFVVLGVIVLLCAGLYIRFKKTRWL